MTNKTDAPLQAIVAFNEAQLEMGKVRKNAANKFLGNSYADLETTQEAIFPTFSAKGFAIVQQCGADEFGQFVDTQAIHVSGHIFSSKVYLEFKKNDMQSMAGAITYARRYGLLSLFGIPVTDDDGNAATGVEEVKQKVIAMADGLERFLTSNPTLEQVIEKRGKRTQVVDGLKAFDKARADTLREQWEALERRVNQ